jgi:hypothetical protein
VHVAEIAKEAEKQLKAGVSEPQRRWFSNTSLQAPLSRLGQGLCVLLSGSVSWDDVIYESCSQI